ncbi:hypothetical protein R9C00_02510 [Flammeovirgaceae bacterium SG7u.111]|nr:hypothetical protein [Flammeovirgaceae bacterium SG7u.132]WPO36312.1 hypothetical protein R9C00_02510 [Flammeovirgaceae bacterium SG7u.111]
MIVSNHNKPKGIYRHISENNGNRSYFNKFESAVKNYEIMVHEERLRRNMAFKFKFESFN